MVGASGGSSGGVSASLVVLLVLIVLWRPLTSLLRSTLRQVWIDHPELPSRKTPLETGGWFDKRRSRLIYRKRKSSFNALADISRPSGQPARVEIWQTPQGAPVLSTARKSYQELPNEAVLQLLSDPSRRLRRAVQKAWPVQYQQWRSAQR